MHKVSSSIQGINYPCGFICKFRSAIGSCGFFSNELRTPISKNLKENYTGKKRENGHPS